MSRHSKSERDHAVAILEEEEPRFQEITSKEAITEPAQHPVESAKMCEQIPIGSRIIAVANAYDALTSRRPYRN